MKERRLAIDSRDSVDENDHCTGQWPLLARRMWLDSAERPVRSETILNERAPCTSCSWIVSALES